MNKVLLALGAPVWMPLLIAFLAVLISLVISVWAECFRLRGHWITGIAMAGAAFFCLEMAIVTFFCVPGRLICG